MDEPSLHSMVRRAVDVLAGDLDGIFGARLHVLVVHGVHAHTRGTRDTPSPHPVETLALVDGLEYRDLAACAERAQAWRGRGLAMPLLLPETEFKRSLDVFPLEYGDIIANHVLVVGRDPFMGLVIQPEDLRRACEVQVRGHAIHLREGFIESGGEPASLSRLLVASAPPFATLLGTLARLSGVGTSDPDALARHLEGVTGFSRPVAERVLALERNAQLAPDEAMRLFPPYLDLMQALARFVDSWSTPATP
ncbi:MAG: hypothetical protein GEU99_04020 [Luteitalea sp.]|nr:hypothetical protein [Luteitalea sp.]